jgi:hypothetical protein
MTISKKLFLIATIGLGLGSFNASAYDVVGLKDEIQLISAFANQHDTVEYDGQTIYLKYWLNNVINSTWMTSNSKIIKIASLIKQHDAVENLLIMREQDQKRRDELIGSILMAPIIAGAGLVFISLMENMRNHRWDHWSLNYNVKHLTELVNKQQKQIDDLMQKVNQTLFQKLFC